MIFYTADLHFGSEKTYDRRTADFRSLGEMDECLVQNWNETVAAEDTVYLVGDVGDHSLPLPEPSLRRLNGHKHLIRGNHDTGYTPQTRLLDFFETVTDFLEIDDAGYHITLCHYPIVYIQNGYMVHGHIHRPEGETLALLKSLERVMNAGVERNGYRPVTLAELIGNNAAFYGEPNRGALGTVRPGRRWKADFQPLPERK